MYLIAGEVGKDALEDTLAFENGNSLSKALESDAEVGGKDTVEVVERNTTDAKSKDDGLGRATIIPSDDQ